MATLTQPDTRPEPIVLTGRENHRVLIYLDATTHDPDHADCSCGACWTGRTELTGNTATWWAHMHVQPTPAAVLAGRIQRAEVTR